MKKVYTVLFVCLIFQGFAQCWKSVSSGVSHSIAIKNDGTLWAWGWNQDGQLGDNTNVSKSIPVQIGSDNNWKDVACGAGHSVALKINGTLWAWGYNLQGQLGDNSIINKNFPVQIGVGNIWKSISCGNSHTIAIKTDSSLWAWGFNNGGQLGDGTTLQRNVPTQVGTEINWKSISAGRVHSNAIRLDGTLWSWGYNIFGQIGDGTTINKTIPTQIGISNDWKNISAGDYHSVAIKLDGTIWSWGYNEYGQLGTGTYTNSSVPIQVGSDNNWQFSNIKYDSNSSYAIKTNGSLWSWGANYSGQLGDGTFIVKLVPSQIGNNYDWLKILGGDFSSAIKINGSLWTWGSNGLGGGLGDGNTIISNIPITISCPTSLNLNNITNSSLKIFPNPVNNILTIQNFINIQNVKIFDIRSQLIKEIINISNNIIDVSELANGLYFLKAENEKQEIFLTKFIKN